MVADLERISLLRKQACMRVTYDMCRSADAVNAILQSEYENEVRIADRGLMNYQRWLALRICSLEETLRAA